MANYIDKQKLYFKTKAAYNTANAQNLIDPKSIAFVEDTKEVITHNTSFPAGVRIIDITSKDISTAIDGYNVSVNITDDNLSQYYSIEHTGLTESLIFIHNLYGAMFYIPKGKTSAYCVCTDAAGTQKKNLKLEYYYSGRDGLSITIQGIPSDRDYYFNSTQKTEIYNFCLEHKTSILDGSILVHVIFEALDYNEQNVQATQIGTITNVVEVPNDGNVIVTFQGIIHAFNPDIWYQPLVFYVDSADTEIDVDMMVFEGSSIATSSITWVQLHDGCVHTKSIYDKAVTTEKLADYAVTTEKLADYSVGTDKLADETVTKDKLANDVIIPEIKIFTYTASNIETNFDQILTYYSTNWDEIKAGNIIVKLYIDNSLFQPISSYNSTFDELYFIGYYNYSLYVMGGAQGDYRLEKLFNSDLDYGTLKTHDIADKAVTTDKLQSAAVTTDKLADKAVTKDKLADGIIKDYYFTVDNSNISDGLYEFCNAHKSEILNGDIIVHVTFTGTQPFSEGNIVGFTPEGDAYGVATMYGDEEYERTIHEAVFFVYDDDIVFEDNCYYDGEYIKNASITRDKLADGLVRDYYFDSETQATELYNFCKANTAKIINGSIKVHVIFRRDYPNNVMFGIVNLIDPDDPETFYGMATSVDDLANEYTEYSFTVSSSEVTLNAPLYISSECLNPIGTNQIVDWAITTAKIRDKAVTEAKLSQELQTKLTTLTTDTTNLKTKNVIATCKLSESNTNIQGTLNGNPISEAMLYNYLSALYPEDDSVISAEASYVLNILVDGYPLFAVKKDFGVSSESTSKQIYSGAILVNNAITEVQIIFNEANQYEGVTYNE